MNFLQKNTDSASKMTGKTLWKYRQWIFKILLWPLHYRKLINDQIFHTIVQLKIHEGKLNRNFLSQLKISNFTLWIFVNGPNILFQKYSFSEYHECTSHLKFQFLCGSLDGTCPTWWTGFVQKKIFAKPLLQLRSTRKVKTLLFNLLIICLFNSLFSINGFKTDMKTRMSKTRKSFYYLNAAGEKNL